jgi:hypothetical protein
MDTETYIWKMWLIDKDNHTQVNTGTVTLIR